ncbi:M23 family metallopeptidase [Streptomyces acidiscabies]|uniref:M23 family metallopeptidase n=1 Tax=Streptomyces acidiscabies TaxID=42234 RepID=UPI0038F7F64F
MLRKQRTRTHRLGAAIGAVLLVALTAAPAGAGEPFRDRAARLVQEHERARAQVGSLRRADAAPKRIRAAERRRTTLRNRLWDMLRAHERALGDPVAVNPSGKGARCPRGGATVAPRAVSRWTAPARGYWLSAGYAAQGSRWQNRHTGQDFAVGTGTPVYAVGAGEVRVTTCGDGFGNQILVRHRDGYFTQYAHLSRIDVRKGQRVAAGQRIGLSGASGNVTGPHLHFEVRITPYLGSAVPPLPWLKRKSVQVVR